MNTSANFSVSLTRLIATISLLLITVNSDKLLMIQQVFRHGARYPIFFHKQDHSDIATQWKSGGELTTQGKNMHYLLGKILYDKYWMQLFEGTPYERQYNQSQFYVKSTDVNRTIESAQSQLLGWLQNLPPLQLDPQAYQYSTPAWDAPSDMIEPTKNESWNIFTQAPTYHTIPIHVQKLIADKNNEGDFLRKFDEDLCPNQQFWRQQNLNTERYLSIKSNRTIVGALQALSNALNTSVTFQNAGQWTDDYICLKYLGLKTLPIFQSKQYAPIFSFIQTYTTYQKRYSQPDEIKAVGTSFVRHTLDNLQGKINGTFTPSIVLYSAHDTTIAMVLIILEMTSAKCIADNFIDGIHNKDSCIIEYPRFSANIVIQLWEKDSHNSSQYLRILYNGKPKKIPICGNKTQCPVQQFKEWAESFMVDNVAAACGFYEEQKHLYAVIFILICIIFIMVLYILYTKHLQSIVGEESNKQKYEAQVDENIH